MSRLPASSSPSRALPIALGALAILLLSAPLASASPYDWRSYPNGDRAVAADLADDWLLLDARAPDPLAIANVLGKIRPAATLARIQPLVPGRVAIEVQGADADVLRELGEGLIRNRVAAAYWPAFARETGRGFFDDRLAVRIESEAALKTMAALGVRPIAESYVSGVWWAEALDGDAIGAAWALQGRPGIVWAEPDLIRDAVAHQISDDPRVDEQWHLDSDDRAGSIDAPGAWLVTKGSPDIVVGIFDTGYDADHPDLVDNVVGGFDALANDDDPSAECSASPDGQGAAGSCNDNAPYRESHGTAVAGVAASRGDNGVLGSGVCPQCSLFLVRMIGEGGRRSLSNAETFQRAADAGVDVINNSWGPSITRFFPLGRAEREVFLDITTRGRDGKGIVLLFAAGNDFFTPATANPYATDPGVITVAASTRVDDFACYSNYGDVIAIAAPSQGCFNDEPGIATADYAGAEGYGPGDFTNGFGGTSAASPVAAGLAGLILSANPELTAQQVRLVMQISAEKIRADKHDWSQVIGDAVDLAEEFDYDERGFSRGFGYGRINAARAVAAAAEPPAVAGPCGEGCPRCIDDRCVTDCETDDDCPGASRCFEQTDGALGCALPLPAPTDPGQPCVADCEVCVDAFDASFDVARVCSNHCESDDDCPFGFDCRTLDPAAPRACVPGNQECGAPYRDVRCQSRVAVEGDGNTFCSCDCFSDEPGACPDGFVCSYVSCRRSRGGLICEPVENQFQGNYLPHCVPDPDVVVETPCETHADCVGGLFCIDGLCAPDREEGGCDTCVSCNGDDDCADGSACVDTARGRKCLQPCDSADDGQCPADTVCIDVPGDPGDHCVNPDYASKGVCPLAYRCAEEGRCFDDADCEEGITCGDDRFCEEPEPIPDMAPPEPDPVDGGAEDPDMGLTVIETPRAGRGDGCTVATPASGTGWLPPLLLGLGLLGLRRRR